MRAHARACVGGVCDVCVWLCQSGGCVTTCCVLCVYCAACIVYYDCALCLWVGVGTKVGVFIFGVDLNNIVTSIILYRFIPARISLPFTGVL